MFMIYYYYYYTSEIITYSHFVCVYCTVFEWVLVVLYYYNCKSKSFLDLACFKICCSFQKLWSF